MKQIALTLTKIQLYSMKHLGVIPALQCAVRIVLARMYTAPSAAHRTNHSLSFVLHDIPSGGLKDT